MIKTIFMSSILIESGWCSASTPRKHVAQSYCHVEERAQQEKKVKKLLHQIELAETRVRAAIRIWDEEDQFRVYALNQFDKSVKTFNRYLNATGEFEASAAAGGNGAYDMQLNCQEKLANERLKLLLEQEKYFTNIHLSKQQGPSLH